jgi:CRISPR/Cas system CSM-associated protein Csm3 (group 7 of RAMP superfamily)
MMLKQVRFTARLKLLSDLHIGTGDSRTLHELRPAGPERLNDDAQQAEVAVVVRDAAGQPIIPATALKGALRKAVEAAHGEELRSRLFGEIKRTEWKRVRGEEVPIDSGRSGRVWLRLAHLTEPPNVVGLPFFDETRRTFITTHVAIDDKTRTAAAQKLFHVERVPAGSAFWLSGVYIVDETDDDAEAAARRDLPLAFAPLKHQHGLGIGADGKLGGGRLTLEGAIECACWWFDPDSGTVRNDRRFTVEVAAGTADGGIESRKTIKLFCRGPYLTIDPAEPREGNNKLRAARRGEALPALPASSLLGVLRDRAAWLARTEDGITAGDDPVRTRTASEIEEGLTPTERLFGVPGWRGLLRVVSVEMTGGTPELLSLPGIAIDRFSGGTLDSALYETEAFVGVRFTVVLQLDRRDAHPADEERRLFDLLIENLRTEEDLLLGHGTNRGFGWFKVESAI